MSKFVEANEKIAETVVEGYKDGETVEDAKKRLSGKNNSEN